MSKPQKMPAKKMPMPPPAKKPGKPSPKPC